MSEHRILTSDPYYAAAQEDRSAPRSRLAIPATLRFSGWRGVPTVVHDLSLSGFCAAAVSRVRPGTICWLTLPGLEALQAEVVWWDNSLTGAAFETLLSDVVYDNLLARWHRSAAYRPI